MERGGGSARLLRPFAQGNEGRAGMGGSVCRAAPVDEGPQGAGVST